MKSCMWTDTELATLTDALYSTSERTLINTVTTTASQNYTITYKDAPSFDPSADIATYRGWTNVDARVMTDMGWRNISPYVITEGMSHDYIDDLKEMLAKMDLSELIGSIGADIKIRSDDLFVAAEDMEDDCDTSGVEEFLEGIEVVND